LADAKENMAQGRALKAFYKRNHLKAGDMFLVPLPNRNPTPAPVIIPKYDLKKTIKDLILLPKPEPRPRMPVPYWVVPLVETVEEYGWIIAI